MYFGNKTTGAKYLDTALSRILVSMADGNTVLVDRYDADNFWPSSASKTDKSVLWWYGAWDLKPKNPDSGTRKKERDIITHRRKYKQSYRPVKFYSSTNF